MYISSGTGARALGYLGDASTDLGNQLWQEAPAGVNVAIFFADPEQKRRAVEWAARERALGAPAARPAVAALQFGVALPDDKNLVRQITHLGNILKEAVAVAPKPAGITPLPNTGPALIRTLGLFTHGTSTGISIGGRITNSSVAKVIDKIAPFLTDDVRIILYGCSSARSADEPSDWVVTTTSGGGAQSLAGKFRDALIAAGKSRATVWGHTQVGHTTRNPSLRVFNAASGKGADGHSFVSETIFGTIYDNAVLDEIESTLGQLGFAIDAALQPKVRAAARKKLRRLRYLCWVRAGIRFRTVGKKEIKENNLTFRGGNLSEVAPLYPLDVADLVRGHWTNTCWSQAARERTAKDLARELKLKRAKAAASR